MNRNRILAQMILFKSFELNAQTTFSEVADKSRIQIAHKGVRFRSKAHAVITFAIINCEYHLIAILLKVISLLNWVVYIYSRCIEFFLFFYFCTQFRIRWILWWGSFFCAYDWAFDFERNHNPWGNIKTTLCGSSTPSRRHFTRVQSRIMNHLPFFIVNNYGSTLYCVQCAHTMRFRCSSTNGMVELLRIYCCSAIAVTV